MRKTTTGERAAASRRIRTLFFNTRDTIGADVAVHISLIRSLERARNSIFVVSNSQASDVDRMRAICSEIPDTVVRFMPLGMPSIRLGQHGKLVKLAVGMQMVGSLLRVLAMIGRDKIDLIHSTDRPRDAFFSTLLARLSGITSVVHMHSNSGDFLGKLTNFGLANATAVVAVSNGLKCGLVKMGVSADRIYVVHNAVDAATFDPTLFEGHREAIRLRYEIPKDAPVIGIVARLIPWKGHYELLDALKILLHDYPELRLLVVGTGSEEQALRDRAHDLSVEDAVIFTGWTDDVPSMMTAMDVFSLPSYEEPFGLAIIEAMAMNLPVIACDSGGVPEIIEDSVNGRLVPPRDSSAIARAVTELLSRPDIAKAIGAAGRRTVLSKFTPANQASAMSELYTAIVSRR